MTAPKMSARIAQLRMFLKCFIPIKMILSLKEYLKALAESEILSKLHSTLFIQTMQKRCGQYNTFLSLCVRSAFFLPVASVLNIAANEERLSSGIIPHASPTCFLLVIFFRGTT